MGGRSYSDEELSSVQEVFKDTQVIMAEITQLMDHGVDFIDAIQSVSARHSLDPLAIAATIKNDRALKARLTEAAQSLRLLKPDKRMQRESSI
jgi:hypothetical protein